jgi:PAS domain S-box-containing protein
MPATEMRKTGVDVVGDVPWGTHFCLFYETRTDLLETIVSYCKAGLENHEFCLWVVAEPLREEDARQALERAIPDIDQYFADQSIEIVTARDWYFPDGQFDLNRVIAGWNQKLAHASAKGYAGVRVTGDTAWLKKKHWKDFCEYEESLNQAVANQRLAVLCTYPLAACGAAEILDVVRTHQFAVTKRRGTWDVIETAGHKQAKAEIKRLNEELEQRVLERTSELTAVNRELTKEVLQRKRAEEALLRSEAYLAEAQRLTHTGSWACNIATREILHSSEEHSRLYGFDPENWTPSFEEMVQRIHPEDRARFVETAERADCEGKDFEVHFRAVLPDGTIKYVYGVAHPVFKPSGDVGEFVGILIDVTERRLAEQATRLLAAVVESSHDAIVSKKLDGVITSWNKGAEGLFGYTAEEAVGHNITLIIPPDHRDEEKMIVERLTRGERVDHFETVRMRKDGSLLDVALTISPMKDAAGRIVGASKLARDITERKRAEEALRQAQADLAYMSRITTMGELTASLAHEIKQPITAAVINAKTCLRLLGRDVPDVAEACEAASRLVKDVTRATDIISRINLLFKKGAPQREFVAVNDLIREMIVMLRSEANRYSISIRTELAEHLPMVMADRVQLQQVFMNLMLNGIDAMKEASRGSELTITSQPDDGQVLISVSDTGVGLSPQQADQIFRAFFTTKDNGTGMGLPISRSIIESHGGHLWAAGASGRGATFQFTLPATVAADA